MRIADVIKHDDPDFFTALVNLVDFCQDNQDGEIRERATMVVDLLLFDLTLNSFKGVFGSTHGRSYEAQKKWAGREDMADTQKLLFGRGQFSLEGSMSAICLALSQHYRMPAVLYEVANDLDRAEMINRQRLGIRLAEAERYLDLIAAQRSEWSVHRDLEQPATATPLLFQGFFEVRSEDD